MLLKQRPAPLSLLLSLILGLCLLSYIAHRFHTHRGVITTFYHGLQDVTSPRYNTRLMGIELEKVNRNASTLWREHLANIHAYHDPNPSHIESRHHNAHHPTTHLKSRPNLHVLLPISHPTLQFCQSLSTMILSGLHPTLIGFQLGSTRVSAHQSKNDKLEKGFAYLDAWERRKNEGWEEEDLVMVVDAMDVFVQLPKGVLVERFLREPYDIMTGAERTCWPPAQWWMCEAYKGTVPARPVYNGRGDELDREYLPNRANAGFYLGRYKPMRSLFHSLNIALEMDVTDDQGVLQFEYFYKGGERWNMTLDYASSLVMLVGFAETDYSPRGMTELPRLGDHRKGEVTDEVVPEAWESVDDRMEREYLDFGDHVPWTEGKDAFTPQPGPQTYAYVYNAFTDRFPGMLHFSGGAKHRGMGRSWYKMWWATGGSTGEDLRAIQAMIRNGRVKIAGEGDVTWDEVCGRFRLAGEGEW